MPKLSDEPIEKVLIALYKRDLDFLRQCYADNVGVSPAVRRIVRAFVAKVTAEADQKIDQTEAQTPSENEAEQ